MDSTKKKNYLRVAIILAAGVAISWLLVVSKPKPEPGSPPESRSHLADVITIALESLPITVTSQGSVTPKTEIDITAQVSGQVVSVGEHFAAGGFFAAGETLLTIDPRDYEIAVIKAESVLADAKKVLAQEEGQALQAKREWRELGTQSANDLFLRKPQLDAARASVQAAEAGVRQAKINLERTRIALPFPGRVVSVDANLGQFISSGAKLGRVFAADVMEVRLSLTASEMALLNLRAGGKLHELQPLAVDLYFGAGKDIWQWQGKVVRVEAAVDVKSRLFYLVAEIDNSDNQVGADGKPVATRPIQPGIFVEALITSNPHDKVVTLPRTALYQSDQVLVLDEESRLARQTINVLQVDSETLVVQGLEDGQLVLAKPPSFMDFGEVYKPIPVAAVEAQP